ncbi:proteoglycan 4 [Aquarana catesbeiana]|uniref:proteoglycan 4 n=1 Tax=Aquarana catesbeiana TaxID=8400 RepID=UPI003CC94645
MLSPQIFLCFTIFFSVVSAQSEGSCVGRCGQGYFRGDPCHCDYTCMTYMECCLDYKTVCTSEGSCQGRCHEGFIRGQTCDCDASCVSYGKCCPDYEEHCAKPVQKQPPPPPPPQLPDRDPSDDSPKPSRKPEERVPEPVPEDEIQKDEAVPKKGKQSLSINKKDHPKTSSKFSQSPPKKTTKRSPRRTWKKISRNLSTEEDDIEDPFEGNAPASRTNKKYSKKDKTNPVYSTPKKPKKKKRRIIYEYEDESEDPNERPSPSKSKKYPKGKSPKNPRKKKSNTLVESEEETEESEDNVSSSSFSSSSSSSSVKGSKKTKKLSRKNQMKKKPQDEDDIPDPDNPGTNKKPKDKDDEPNKPKSPKTRKGDDDPDKPEIPPKEPNQRNPNDKGDKPKEPRGPTSKERGDDAEGPDKNPKEPDLDDKDGKPKKPKVKNGDDPEDPDPLPKERLPTSPKDEDDKPQKTKTSKVIENTEETEQDEDSPRKPLPSDKRKKNPTDNKPNKKKKVNPEDDADDESPKPGKGKKTKKKPSPKNTVKRKNKVDSEEERQETVSEFSSSSQSSSSHSRSKSIRRKTEKNKKNLKEKNKKKFPEEEEEPENPLMPPKKKYPLPTPVYTTSDEGSGEDGSGMNFLQTTIVSTTIRLNTTTNMATTVGTKNTEGTLKPSINPQTESINGSSYKTTTNIPIPESTGKQSAGSSATTVLYTQRSTQEEKTKELDTTMGTTLQQMSTLKTPQDQSTADSNAKHTTPRLEGTAVTTPGLEGTAVQHKSTPMGPTKHTPESGLTTTLSHSSPGKDTGTSPKTQSIDRSTNKINEYSTTSALFSTRNPNESQSQTSTNPTTRHADDIINKVSAETTTTGQSVKLTTRQPGIDQTSKQPGQRPIPDGGSSYEATTKQSPNAKTTSIPRHTTTTSNHKDSFTTMPINEDDIETNKATTPHTIHPHHICNLLKDEAIRLRIPESDLKLITEICAEMQQQYPNVNIPSSLQTRQPNIDEKKIPPEYPLSEGTPNIWYQQPGSKMIQIIEEIYRRINTSPTTNLTGIPGQDNHRSTAWLLLINKIKRATDPQMNLCIGPPADGMTTLQNGSMVVFRGHYFWTLNQGGVTGMPRKISEVWGIPSPIDTVFTRCNCGGKTFFFKGPRYWRFTNDAMDKGYPKEIIKGFGGLGGKVTAVLSVAGIKTRPESVYFFKPGGNVQKYTFRQEQTKRCTKKKQPSLNYPIYSQKVQTVKFRFPRDIVRHRIEIRRTFTNIPQPLGILHEERSIRSTWRGIPNNIVSAVSLPNPQKQDGFDYFVFTKDKYYNINMSSKVAIKPPPEAEQKTTKDFYKCKE